MKTRILIELEIEGDAQLARDIVEEVLDAGDLQDAINRDDPKEEIDVTSAMVSTLETDLAQILWPEADPDAEWSPDTLDALAERLRHLRPSHKPMKMFTVVGRCESSGDDFVNQMLAVDAKAAAVKTYLNCCKSEREIVAVFAGSFDPETMT